MCRAFASLLYDGLPRVLPTITGDSKNQAGTALSTRRRERERERQHERRCSSVGLPTQPASLGRRSLPTRTASYVSMAQIRAIPQIALALHITSGKVPRRSPVPLFHSLPSAPALLCNTRHSACKLVETSFYTEVCTDRAHSLEAFSPRREKRRMGVKKRHTRR